MMKKNRPGVLLSVLVPSSDRYAAIDILFQETSTIGVRWQEVQRAKAIRKQQTVETSYGPVRVKISHIGESVTNIAPEYDDCKALARKHPEVPLKRIYQAALDSYYKKER
jgi:uncharacterized protein (DUF111 family)